MTGLNLSSISSPLSAKQEFPCLNQVSISEYDLTAEFLSRITVATSFNKSIMMARVAWQYLLASCVVVVWYFLVFLSVFISMREKINVKFMFLSISTQCWAAVFLSRCTRYRCFSYRNDVKTSICQHCAFNQ